MPTTLVIYNPVAGRGRARAAWPHIQQALRRSGMVFDLAVTSAPLDALRLARFACQEYSRLVVVGGDGTLNEVVNGLLQDSGEPETIRIGIIPMGNGDDFAKMLPPQTPVGGKLFGWQAAVQKITRGQTKFFDVGCLRGDHLRPELRAEAYYFLNGMDVGFGAHAARNYVTTPKFLKGMSAYLFAVLKTLIDYPTLHLRIQLDDQPPFEQATTMTAVMNGRCLGNNFWVCPHAGADDGFFDLAVGQKVSRREILNLIPKLMKGTHENEPILRMYRARRVLLESNTPLIVEADGELPYLETHHLEIELLPRKVRLIV